MNEIYKKQVGLLLKIIPTLAEIESFAVHGGTAINLYVLDLPRYSVDIDVTYTPIKPREESFNEIHKNLSIIKEKVKSSIPDVIVTEKPNKIYCNQKEIAVKVEVNGTKRGLIEPTLIKPLCNAAQNEFVTANKVKIVSISQLYGGKITAALDRQHPRDLFDIKLMFDFITDFEQVKKGFFYCLLGGDRPIVESLAPNRIDHQETLVKQFSGMTNLPFSYEDYEQTRQQLGVFVNSNLTKSDREFLISFEKGSPAWQNSEYEIFKDFPSIQWKQLNINKLKEINFEKHQANVDKLTDWLNRT